MGSLTKNGQGISAGTSISYAFIVIALVLLRWLHLGGALIAALFAYLALRKLNFFKPRSRWPAVVIFLVLLAGAAYGLGFVINQAVRVLPDVADQSIPWVLQWAKQHSIELPFTDYDSLRDFALGAVKGQLHEVARVARGATAQFVFVIVAFIVAIGLFLNPRFESDKPHGSRPENLYSICCDAIAQRFTTLYESFSTVMGAQIVISAINTGLTAIFVMVTHLPSAALVVGTTFLCGLVPVVGNLVSNSIVVGIAITVSPQRALAALIFLVVIHKLEYFLNSKIVGDRIRNPFWLTLLALIVGEKLMGVPGMILAPVVLNYIKLEASKIQVGSKADKTPAERAAAPAMVSEG